MARSPIRISSGRPLFDIYSAGRRSPQQSSINFHLSRSQIAHIRRTVGRTAEVMVKVTGGGTSAGTVAAHFGYISREGELEIETDEGERIPRQQHKEFLAHWFLDLIGGQYRGCRDGEEDARKVKLIHKLVFSMPAPTPPEKVLAAASNFAREKFALQHRYALVLHTDQKHPHVHMVVKAVSEDGRRLYINKETLREWREDFARMMREQGIAANATSRVVRGQNKGTAKDPIYRAQRRGASSATREQVMTVVKELKETGTIRDPARKRLLETRKAIVDHWMRLADALDKQGEISLAGDVRYFAKNLPPLLTDRERIAAGLVRHLNAARTEAPPSARIRDRDLTR